MRCRTDRQGAATEIVVFVCWLFVGSLSGIVASCLSSSFGLSIKLRPKLSDAVGSNSVDNVLGPLKGFWQPPLHILTNGGGGHGTVTRTQHRLSGGCLSWGVFGASDAQSLQMNQS